MFRVRDKVRVRVRVRARVRVRFSVRARASLRGALGEYFLHHRVDRLLDLGLVRLECALLEPLALV